MAREKDDLRDSKHRPADAGVRRIRVDRARYAAALILAAWGPNPGHPADLNGDGFVGINDLLELLAAWAFCPPPIGCLADLDCDGAVGINDLLTILANWG